MKKIMIFVLLSVLFCLAGCKFNEKPIKVEKVATIEKLTIPEDKYVVIMDKVNVKELIESVEEAEKIAYTAEEADEKLTKDAFNMGVFFTVMIFVIFTLSVFAIKALLKLFMNKTS